MNKKSSFEDGCVAGRLGLIRFPIGSVHSISICICFWVCLVGLRLGFSRLPVADAKLTAIFWSLLGFVVCACNIIFEPAHTWTCILVTTNFRVVLLPTKRHPALFSALGGVLLARG